MPVRPARTFLWLATAAVLAATVVLSGAAPAPVNIGGFSAALSAAEARWERSLQASIQPRRLRADMRRLSAAPHNAGSARQQQLARWILQQFQADGFQAHLEPFDVLYPTPIERQVELVAPPHVARHFSLGRSRDARTVSITRLRAGFDWRPRTAPGN